MCVCVCVSERERDRESVVGKEGGKKGKESWRVGGKLYIYTHSQQYTP